MFGRVLRFSASFGAASLLSCAGWAGLSPESVAVVVNGRSQDSLRVAHAYARLRGIPDSNFVVLQGVTSTEFTDAEKFRTEVLSPTLATIKARGLTPQIDCITYSLDIPYSVNVTSDIKGRPQSQVITPVASANGLTFLKDWTLKGDIEYLNLRVNRYARSLLPLPSGEELTQAEQAEFSAAMAKYDAKDYLGAITGLEKLLVKPRMDATISYNLACCQALAGRKEASLASLKRAVRSGWRNHGQIAGDPDFDSIKNSDEFKLILAQIKSAPIQVQPGAPFKASTAWGRDGIPAPEGSRYILSTMLGVTAGRGNTIEEILGSLQRAKSADFTAPKGTIYFERNADIRSKTREWGFEPAAAELRKLGVSAVVEDGILPQKRADVAGGVIGIADFDWAASGSTVLPGAIIEHLTSLGGMINKGAGQTPCTDFIRAGAAGSSGAVTEPYALQEKFPTPFIHVQYAKGFTLAESFYQSLSGPYQLLIIGDPLCRPWGKMASFKVSGVKPGGLVKGAVRLTPAFTGPSPVALYHLAVDGKRLRSFKPGQPITLSAAALDLGWHEVSLTAECGDLAASQYRCVVPFQVGTAAVEAPAAVTCPLKGAVRILLQAKGAESIELFSLGRPIGRVIGEKGTAEVSGAGIGQGEALVIPVAKLRSGRSLRGKPIRFTVS